MSNASPRSPEHVDIVFDGPPGNEAPRFIQVENDQGQRISIGYWVVRDNGQWALRIHALSSATLLNETQIEEVIAREIWAYNECPWDFDKPRDGMPRLQKELAIDQAKRIHYALRRRLPQS